MDKYGLDREIAQRREEKFDPNDEAKILEWIETVTELELDSMHDLKSGVHLCLVIEAIAPGLIDFKLLNAAPKHYLEEHANIQLFLNCAAKLGVPSSDLFTLRDVGKNFDKTQIAQCIFALGRQAQALGAPIPHLGVRYYKTIEQQRELERKKEEERKIQAARDAEVSRERKQRREFLEVKKVETETKKSQRTSEKISKRQQDRRSRGRNSLRERKSKKREYDLDEGPVKFGVDLEHEEYMESKYLESSIEEEKCLDWIEEVTGEQVDDLYLHLKSGRTLCRMMNKFIPKTILKINYGHQEFHEMENIKNFLIACASFGIKQVDLFSVNDLYKKQNLALVIKTIQFLSDKLATVAPDYKGPLLGGESKIGWDSSTTTDDLEEEQYHEHARQKRRQDSVKAHRQSDHHYNPRDSGSDAGSRSSASSSASAKILCPCGGENDEERTYCAVCGEILTARDLSNFSSDLRAQSLYKLPKRKPRPQVACVECGHLNDFDRVFCGDCGNSVTQKQPQQQSTTRRRPSRGSPRRRKSKGQTIDCNECGSANDDDRTYCKDCGRRLGASSRPSSGSYNVVIDSQTDLEPIQCHCGHTNDGDRAFCGDCGSPLTAATTTISIPIPIHNNRSNPTTPRRNREKRKSSKSAQHQQQKFSPGRHLVCTCGHLNDNDRVFCGECGSNLLQPSQAALTNLVIPSVNLVQEMQQSPRVNNSKTPRKNSNQRLRNSFHDDELRVEEEVSATSPNNPFFNLHLSQPTTPRLNTSTALAGNNNKTPRKTSNPNHAAMLAQQLQQQQQVLEQQQPLAANIVVEEPAHVSTAVAGSEWKQRARRRSGSRQGSRNPSDEYTVNAIRSRNTSDEYFVDPVNLRLPLESQPVPIVTIPLIKLHQSQETHTLQRKTPRSPRIDIEQHNTSHHDQTKNSSPDKHQQQQKVSPEKKATPEKKPSPEKVHLNRSQPTTPRIYTDFSPIYCNCGYRNGYDATYCGHCGTNLALSASGHQKHNPNAETKLAYTSSFRIPESPRNREPPSPRQPPLSNSKRKADRRTNLKQSHSNPNTPRSSTISNLPAKLDTASSSAASSTTRSSAEMPVEAVSTSHAIAHPTTQNSETTNVLLVFVLFSAIVCVGSVVVISELNEDGSNPWVELFNYARIFDVYFSMIKGAIVNSFIEFGDYFNDYICHIKDTFFSSSL